MVLHSITYSSRPKTFIKYSPCFQQVKTAGGETILKEKKFKLITFFGKSTKANNENMSQGSTQFIDK